MGAFLDKGEAAAVRRAAGLERQYRLKCRECGLNLGYSSTPFDQPMKTIFFLAEAVKYIPNGGTNTNANVAAATGTAAATAAADAGGGSRATGTSSSSSIVECTTKRPRDGSGDQVVSAATGRKHSAEPGQTEEKSVQKRQRTD
uniref:STEEP1 domain-containing protein n=2 Tax=Lotharella globosa TaxID=91324 RepID=A0A7S3YSH0_9EUKA|mmetsp:Transcript_11838/g.22661  ORF Transcript_11838/g.22661 Transcript_11838/m.22661 type:complete len:144 (+) Transcript_11838:259-690(+)